MQVTLRIEGSRVLTCSQTPLRGIDSLFSAGKVFDRMSKGIREAPGKALIGDLASESGDRTEGAFGMLLYPCKPSALIQKS